MIAELISATDAFIAEEQLLFGDGAVSDMQQVGRYIKSQRHLWEGAMSNVPSNASIKVQALRVAGPQIVLIEVPAGASIPIHQHGKGIYGVSGLLTGDLIEVSYAVEGNRIHSRVFDRLTVYRGITYQDRGYLHAVSNMEKNEPAMIVECWLPKLEFTPLRLSGRSIHTV